MFFLAVVVAVGAVVVGARVLTGASARTTAEWAVFLGALALLAGVAAIVVPIGLLTGVDLVW